MKAIAIQYFNEHPEQRDGVIKAYYAYHAPHFRREAKGHNFSSPQRWATCAWCNRSREEVRHDELPPHCEQRPNYIPNTESVFKYELERFAQVERKAGPVIEKHFKDRLASGKIGKELAFLKQTHGIQPDLACDLLGIPFEPHRAEFEATEAQHSQRAKEAFVPEVISA